MSKDIPLSNVVHCAEVRECDVGALRVESPAQRPDVLGSAFKRTPVTMIQCMTEPDVRLSITSWDQWYKRLAGIR